MVKVSASILSTDISSIHKTIEILQQSRIDFIHIDVMDGHFVQDITMGHKFVEIIKKLTSIPLDIHLMVENPEQQIPKFAPYSDIITVHCESTVHIDKLLTQIKTYGVKVGVAMIPSTHEQHIEYLYDHVDYVVVMTVNPGTGGQKLIQSQLAKIRSVKRQLAISHNDVCISVDGGVSQENAQQIISCGTDMLVVGTYLFKDGLGSVHGKIEKIKMLSQSL